MKFIHSGDFHLGMTLKGASFSKSEFFEKRRLELQGVLYKVIEIALNQKSDMLFLTGDLFDDVLVKPTAINALFQELSRLSIPVFVVIGNHDRFLHNKAYEPIRNYTNIHFFSKNQRTIQTEFVDVHGFNTYDFDENELEELTKNLNPTKKHVLCLHGDVLNKKDDHYLTSLANLKKYPFDYIALGHIHKHQFLAPNIAYSGNPEPFDFSETDEKGVIIGDLSNLKSYRFIPCALRKFHIEIITLTPQDTVLTLQEKIASFDDKILKKDFIRIIFKGIKNDNLELSEPLFELLREEAFYIEFKDESQRDFNLKTLKNYYKDTIISDLIEAYEEETNQDEESLMLALQTLLESKEGL